MDESRKKSTEDHDLSSGLLGTVIVRLDQGSTKELVRLLAERIEIFLDDRLPGKTGGGVRVLKVSEVARSLDKTRKELKGLESRGKLPRRRRLSGRRVGYLAHEVDGLSADAVQVRDDRTVTPKQLAHKLGLGSRTIDRMAGNGDLPPRVDGHRWHERDIDEWLLGRPQVLD